MSQNSKRTSKRNSIKSNQSRLSSLTNESEFYIPYGEDETLYKPTEAVPLIGKFAKLKYGNDKEIIFNIDCQVKFFDQKKTFVLKYFRFSRYKIY